MTKKKEQGGRRPGAGRKQELEGAVTKTIILDKESLRRIEAYQEAHKVGLSAAIRRLIRGILPRKNER